MATEVPKAQVHLAHLPQWCVDQPPLGIAYLTGFLKAKGYEVRQVDYSVQLFAELPSHQKHFLDSSFCLNWLNEKEYNEVVLPVITPWIEKWAQELAQSSASVIGFTMLTTSRRCTLQVIRRLRELSPSKFIVVGGPHVTRYEGGPEVLEDPDVDVIVPGEGEEVFYELVKAIPENQPLDQIPGLMFKRDGQIIDTGERKLIQSISELPFPEFSGFDLHSYRSLTLPILGSRGCIYKCAFCSETVLWRRFRFRTGENIFQEFKKNSEEHGVYGFYIVDSLINGNIKELEILCDRIIEAGLQVRWSGKASIRRQMTPDLLQKMREAGCHGLDYGLESGSAQVVKDMKKGFDLPTARQVIHDTNASGIQVGLFLIAGFPTETEEHFQETLAFLKENEANITRVTPGFGMGIQAGSDVQLNQDHYGVYWKDGDWYSEVTSPEIRANRLHRLKEFCSTLDVQIS